MRRPTITPPPNRAASGDRAPARRVDPQPRVPEAPGGDTFDVGAHRIGSKRSSPLTARRRRLVVGGLAILGLLVAAEVISRMSDAPDGDAGFLVQAETLAAERTVPQLMVIVPDAPGAIAARPASESADGSPDDAGDAGASAPISAETSDSATTAPLSESAGEAVGESRPDWEAVARSVVHLRSPDCGQSGSGIILGDGLSILTNSHVVHRDGDGSLCETFAGFTQRFDQPPDGWQRVSLVAADPIGDLAVVRLAAGPGPMHPPLEVAAVELGLGEEVTILGYPSFGDSQDTLTFTSGRFSGATTSADGLRLWKTDALLDSGVSGGAVLDGSGQLVGVATGGLEGDGGTLGLIIPAAEILRFVAIHGIPTVAAPDGRKPGLVPGGPVQDGAEHVPLVGHGRMSV